MNDILRNQHLATYLCNSWGRPDSILEFLEHISDDDIYPYVENDTLLWAVICGLLVHVDWRVPLKVMEIQQKLHNPHLHIGFSNSTVKSSILKAKLDYIIYSHELYYK